MLVELVTSRLNGDAVATERPDRMMVESFIMFLDKSRTAQSLDLESFPTRNVQPRHALFIHEQHGMVYCMFHSFSRQSFPVLV